jgi:hypothetical protein
MTALASILGALTPFIPGFDRPLVGTIPVDGRSRLSVR